MQSTQLLIGDQWVSASDGATSETIDPATNTVIGTFAEATGSDVDAAVASARAGFESDSWQGMTPDERGKVLWRIAELLERDADQIAALETLDQGMPSFVSGGISLPLAAQVFRYYAGFATKIEGKVSPISIWPSMS